MDVLAASFAALASTTIAAAAESPAEFNARGHTRDLGSLVLPGGGARGAYEAGVIEGVRQRAGISDGMPLPGVDLVVGTSIGSINGWFVATAQYAKLRYLWQTISSDNIFQLKQRYRATQAASSGLLTRVYEAAMLANGLTSDVTGLFDGSRVHTWLAEHIDPTTPVVVPLIFSCTRLELQRSEIFYRLPAGTASAEGRTRSIQRLHAVLGESIDAREVTEGTLIACLAGSSAIPIVFDPVAIEFEDGIHTYIDGGVADSAPLDVARAIGRRVQLILVDPANSALGKYPNAASVGTLAFAIAQNRILDTSLRSAYLETTGKRLFDKVSLTREQQVYFENVFDVEISLIRPDAQLDVTVMGFDDAAGVARAYETGRLAGYAGFQPYDPGTLLH